MDFDSLDSQSTDNPLINFMAEPDYPESIAPNLRFIPFSLQVSKFIKEEVEPVLIPFKSYLSSKSSIDV